MMRQKRTFRKTRRLADAAMVAILVVIFVSFALFLASSNLKLKHRQADVVAKIGEAEETRDRLTITTEQLTAQIAQQHTDAELEAQARERFNLKKPGEEVVVIVTEESDVAEAGSGIEDKSVWRSILEFFGL